MINYVIKHSYKASQHQHRKDVKIIALRPQPSQLKSDALILTSWVTLQPSAANQSANTDHATDVEVRIIRSQCAQKKNIPKNEYVRNFKIYFKETINQFLCLECLIDSGSPISFVKQSSLGHIRTNFETTNFKSNEMLNLNYSGLNNSRLNIIGKIPSFVIMNTNEYNFELLIVTDESMGYDAVLGRDFMNICKFKIIRENDSSENDSITNENRQRDRKKNIYIKQKLDQ